LSPMLKNSQRESFWIGALVFSIAFGITMAACRITIAPGVGAGSAAGWAAESIGEGNGHTAILAPLFRLMVRFTGSLGPVKDAALRLNYLTTIGHSLAAGIISIGLLFFFRRWKIWGAPMVAAWGGILAGVTRLGWASALLVNPATWSLALSILSFVLLVYSYDSPEKKLSNRLFLLAGWTMGLSLAVHLAAIIIMPLFLGTIILNKNKIERHAFLMLILGIAIPLSLFILLKAKPFFLVYGLFVAPPGISELADLKFVGWSGLWALTPAALPFALWGLVKLLIQYPKFRILFVLLAFGIIAGGFSGTDFYQFAALALSTVIAILAVTGIADILNRLAGGYAFALWLLIPFIWWGHGSLLNRNDETIWETHVSNAIRTVRLNSLVLSVDDELINAPYAYLRIAKNMRQDLAVFNPIHLNEPGYLDRLEKRMGSRLDIVRGEFDALRKVADQSEPGNFVMEKTTSDFLTGLVRAEVKRSGVLIAPGVRFPAKEFSQVAEGLFVRLLDDRDPYPFHFTGLDMEPIEFSPGDPSLKQHLVAMYPMMFASRGSWMLKKRFTAEGIDYIRWALKIDPDYIPAKILANDYGISGPPQYLGK